jgi:hypothetical protein
MLPSCPDDSESLRRSLDRFNGKPHRRGDPGFRALIVASGDNYRPMTSATDLNLWIL